MPVVGSLFTELPAIGDAYEIALETGDQEMESVLRLIILRLSFRNIICGESRIIRKSLAQRTKYPKLFGGLYWDIPCLVDPSDKRTIENRNRFAESYPGIRRKKTLVRIKKMINALDTTPIKYFIDHPEVYFLPDQQEWLYIISPYSIPDGGEKLLEDQGFTKIPPMYRSAPASYLLKLR